MDFSSQWMAFASRFPMQTLIIIYFNQKYKKIQLKINNEIIKAFKASNKTFEGMSDYNGLFLPIDGFRFMFSKANI